MSTDDKNENDYTLGESVGGWQGTAGVLFGTGLLAFPAGSAFAPVFARWVPAMATVEGIVMLGFVLWAVALAWVLHAMVSARAAAERQGALLDGLTARAQRLAPLVS